MFGFSLVRLCPCRTKAAEEDYCWYWCIAGSSRKSCDFNSGYESDQSSHVGRARVYIRDTPYQLRSREVEDAMSDNELLENETLIDGQDAGAA